MSGERTRRRENERERDLIVTKMAEELSQEGRQC
jgi:hypothetical protein